MYDELKIKRASLAAESKLIRRQELRLAKARVRMRKYAKEHDNIDPSSMKGWNENLNTNVSLHTHRTHDVRKEARSSHLAYCFLKGTPYLKVEHKCYENPDFDKVTRLVIKFGGEKDERVIRQKLAQWFDRVPYLDRITGAIAGYLNRVKSLITS